MGLFQRIFHREFQDCDEPGYRPNRASRRALREVRGYERGEIELEPLDTIVSENRGSSLYMVVATSRFKKDLRRMEKRGEDPTLLFRAIDILKNGGVLPPSYRDHALTGNWSGHRECHIGPDWLFIYSIDDGELILKAIRTGNHMGLFE